MRPFVRRRVLMACSNYWNSPIQVGDQQIARLFVKEGWEVAYVSTPISPLHFLGGFTCDLRERLATYRAGGTRDLLGGRFGVLLTRNLPTTEGVSHKDQESDRNVVHVHGARASVRRRRVRAGRR